MFVFTHLPTFQLLGLFLVHKVVCRVHVCKPVCKIWAPSPYLDFPQWWWPWRGHFFPRSSPGEAGEGPGKDFLCPGQRKWQRGGLFTSGRQLPAASGWLDLCALNFVGVFLICSSCSQTHFGPRCALNLPPSCLSLLTSQDYRLR